MKIANILGRGIEGAGVTRFASELDYYINNKTNHHIDTFVLLDRHWPREKAQNTNKFIIMKVKSLNLQQFVKKLNTYDAVIYNSVPAKNFSELAKEYFNIITEDVIHPKKFSIQNDHKKASLNRNINIYDFNDKMDGIFTFSFDSAFARALKERNSNIEQKLIVFRNGMNFEYFDQFAKKFEDKIKRISYLGRFAGFKDPWRLIHFHPYVKKYNFITDLLGIERSIGAYEFLDNNKEKLFDYSNKKFINVSEIPQTSSKPYVYGPYVRTHGLQYVSRSLFGASFFNITSEKENHGNTLEYAQLEMIAVGAIPVYDYDWSRNTKNIDGNAYGDISNFGLFLKRDLSNAEEIANKMNEISGNKELAEKYMMISYQIAYRNFGNMFAFSEFLRHIEERL